MRRRRHAVLLQADGAQGTDPSRPDDPAIPSLAPTCAGGQLMLISLRGTHGSGKSTAVRTLMGQATCRPVYDVLFGLRHPEAYELRLPHVARSIYVMGPYQTPCGGCDAIQPFALIAP